MGMNHLIKREVLFDFDPMMITQTEIPVFQIVDEAPSFHLVNQEPTDLVWNEMMAMIDLFLHPDDYFQG